jgi:hypothetical protein
MSLNSVVNECTMCLIIIGLASQEWLYGMNKY